MIPGADLVIFIEHGVRQNCQTC